VYKTSITKVLLNTCVVIKEFWLIRVKRMFDTPFKLWLERSHKEEERQEQACLLLALLLFMGNEPKST